MAVMTQIGNDVTFPHPQARQGIGKPMNTLSKFRITEAPAFANNTHLLRKKLLRAAQEHEWAQRDDHWEISDSGLAKDIRGRSGDVFKNGRSAYGLVSHVASQDPKPSLRSVYSRCASAHFWFEDMTSCAQTLVEPAPCKGGLISADFFADRHSNLS